MYNMYVCHTYKCSYEHVLSMKNHVVCLVDALGFLTSHDFVVFPTLVWVIYTAHSLKLYIPGKVIDESLVKIG